MFYHICSWYVYLWHYNISPREMPVYHKFKDLANRVRWCTLSCMPFTLHQKCVYIVYVCDIKWWSLWFFFRKVSYGGVCVQNPLRLPAWNNATIYCLVLIVYVLCNHIFSFTVLWLWRHKLWDGGCVLWSARVSYLSLIIVYADELHRYVCVFTFQICLRNTTVLIARKILRDSG